MRGGIRKRLRATFRLCTKQSVLSGLVFLAKSLFNAPGTIIRLNLAGLKHPVYLRNRNDDISVLMQVLIKKQYELDVFKKPKFIIDAGGHIGMTSIYFANRYEESTIITLEPHPDNFSILQRNIDPYSNIIAVRKALSGRRTLMGLVSESSRSFGHQYQEASGTSDLNVESTTVMELLEMTGGDNVDIFKMDIEGQEYEVFNSLNANEKPFTDILIVETHDNKVPGATKSLFKYLNHYDYSCTIKGDNYLVRFHIT